MRALLFIAALVPGLLAQASDIGSKDLYQVLSVTRQSTNQDIKKSYRRLVRKYHPDVSKEPDAEAKFKEIKGAYEILKDPEKRAAYEKSRDIYLRVQAEQKPSKPLPKSFKWYDPSTWFQTPPTPASARESQAESEAAQQKAIYTAQNFYKEWRERAVSTRLGSEGNPDVSALIEMLEKFPATTWTTEGYKFKKYANEQVFFFLQAAWREIKARPLVRDRPVKGMPASAALLKLCREVFELRPVNDEIPGFKELTFPILQAAHEASVLEAEKAGHPNAMVSGLASFIRTFTADPPHFFSYQAVYHKTIGQHVSRIVRQSWDDIERKGLELARQPGYAETAGEIYFYLYRSLNNVASGYLGEKYNISRDLAPIILRTAFLVAMNDEQRAHIVAFSDGRDLTPEVLDQWLANYNWRARNKLKIKIAEVFATEMPNYDLQYNWSMQEFVPYIEYTVIEACKALLGRLH